MPIPLAAVGGIVSGIGALGKLFGGGAQKRRARRMLRSLKDPGYNIPKEFEQNLAKAEQMAKTGMPSQEYNLATTNIQRGTQAGLRQLSRMSNPFAGISGLARSQSDALGRLDAQNASVRRQNILQAMGARRELAGQKLAQQQYAQQQYMNKVNQANALLGAGYQNQMGAFGDIANIGMAIASSGEDGGGGRTMGQIYNNPTLPYAPSVGVSNTGTISTPKTLPGYKIGG